MAPSAADPPRSDLFVEYLEPTTAPQGVVVVVHGYAEYSGRYAGLAERLLDKGFCVVLYDHRGFGRSPGRPGYIGRIESLVADLGGVVASAKQVWSDLPVYLFGHSLGGLIAALFCLERAQEISGIVLSSPLIRTQESPLLQRVANVIGTLAPRLPTVRMDRSAISRDPAVVAEAEADPLNYHGRLLARTGAEFVRGMRILDRDIEQITLPVLVLHGTADRLTDPEGSRDFYTRVSSNHRQLNLFEGAYHETFHDLDRERVLEEIMDWLGELPGT